MRGNLFKCNIFPRISLHCKLVVEILLVASCHGNRDKLRPDGPSDFSNDAETLLLPLLPLLSTVYLVTKGINDEDACVNA